MNPLHETTLCIFAKAPHPGAVKTRLAATIGDRAAVELARAFLLDSLALAERLAPGRVVVVLSGDESALPNLRRRVEVWPQGDGDLGARLERALRRALRESSRALAIGTDSPGLPLTLLELALGSLEHSDAVVGPADDGGFYLIGLKQCPEGLLADIPWSAAETRERTLARLHERRLGVHLLPPWFDVDVAADLERLRALLEAGEIVAPETAEVLGTLSARGAP